MVKWSLYLNIRHKKSGFEFFQYSDPHCTTWNDFSRKLMILNPFLIPVFQDELTTELSDFKEKYREVVDLLHDTREELRASKRKSYPGLGQHNVSSMFTGSPADGATPDPSKKGNFCGSTKTETRAPKLYPPPKKKIRYVPCCVLKY